MGLLMECPKCKYRNSLKKDKCKCGLAIKKLGNKIYWIEWYDETGRKRRERIGPSKQAAEQRYREVLKARTEDRHIEKDRAARMSLKQLSDWYKGLGEVKAKRSFARDVELIDNLLTRLKEETKIRDITPGRIDSYRTSRQQEPSPRYPGEAIRPATVNREVACLKSMLNRAVRHHLIRENPLAGYKMGSSGICVRVVEK